jgi:hypothetical protein
VSNESEEGEEGGASTATTTTENKRGTRIRRGTKKGNINPTSRAKTEHQPEPRTKP